MQKVIFIPIISVLLMGYNTEVSASISVNRDTIVNNRISAEVFSITNLTGITDLRTKKDDPKLYYGKWQWVSGDRDTFTIHIEANNGQLDKEGKASKADVICYYSIVKNGDLRDSVKSKESFLFGFTAEKQLMIAPAECKIENLDESSFFSFQLASDDRDVGNLNKGRLLPFLNALFNGKLSTSTKISPVDLTMRKVSGIY